MRRKGCREKKAGKKKGVRDKNVVSAMEVNLKKVIPQPPTECEVISFHMYAIKAELLKLAWVATLHLRHAAMMISFDRLFLRIQNDRYLTWGYCAEIMSAEYV